MIIENYFSYFSTKAYVVGTQKPSKLNGSFEDLKHIFKLIGKGKTQFQAENFCFEINWAYVLL